MESSDRATVMGVSVLGYLICLVWILTSDADNLWKWVFSIAGGIVALFIAIAASPDAPESHHDSAKNS